MFAKTLIVAALVFTASAYVLLEVSDNDSPKISDAVQELKSPSDEAAPAVPADTILTVDDVEKQHGIAEVVSIPLLSSPEARRCQTWSCFNSCRLAGYNNGYCIYGGCICGN